MSQRLKSLIPRLVERTSARQMEWQALADTFMHSLPGAGGVLVLNKSRDTYRLSLWNSALKEIDFETDVEKNGQLATLYEMIYKKALKLDETYDSLEKDLGLK